MKLFFYFVVSATAILLQFSCLSFADSDQQLPIHNQHQHHSNHLNVKTILAQHDKPNQLEAHTKHFKGETLAYVTPWNNRGYDIVKEFKGKFDYVSPVWYYIQRRSSMQFDIDGEHDVDQGWIKEVRDESTGKGKVLPRFQLRGWTGDDLRYFVTSAEESKVLAVEINKQVQKYGFDGIVLECGFPAFFQLFLTELSHLLHQENRLFIVVLPSVMTDEHKQYMKPDVVRSMAKYVDRFSLMTYDYSSHDPNGGPSSPIEWVMDNIEYLTDKDNRNKFLVGLNMYAMSYLQTRAPEPLVLKTVLEKLAEQPNEIDDELLDEKDSNKKDSMDEELNWDKDSQEAWFVDIDEDGTRQGTIWMPTLRSIRNRVRLAEDYGVGLALWEVGQGLDYFYDLF
ncbi:glycoside hydrolase superfamily [Gilbertella persicaria]|uniref:glycoside hydrolase superfamily n=1 Tax=Gilbertella persicaria TaxID=101096 RepID=UPI00221EDEA3|nr:glycoside hydrolase superfamily [Gilbertella persicaria]KAI8098413.1 glycoside hydrolase superfamily [Gilbertella persicaria]